MCYFTSCFIMRNLHSNSYYRQLYCDLFCRRLQCDSYYKRLPYDSSICFIYLLNVLTYTFHLENWFMWLYDLLCNVRTYIALPTIDNYIAITFAEVCTAILSTRDCLMIPLFASSTCLMFYLVFLLKDLIHVTLGFDL